MRLKHFSRRAVIAAAAAFAIAAPAAGAHDDVPLPNAGAGYAHARTHDPVASARDAASGSIRDLPPKLRSLARGEQNATAAYRAAAGTPAAQGRPSTSDTPGGLDWVIPALVAGALAGFAALALGTSRGRRHRAQTVGG